MNEKFLMLKQLFLEANKYMLEKDISLFDFNVSERTICASLKSYIQEKIKKTRYSKYYTDVEYNRNVGGKLKTIRKTIYGPETKIINITCDLIVHSRGEITEQDNLIAIEMKKSTRPRREKTNDRDRLITLTKDSFDDVWSFDGKVLPEHVCRYIIGIYYEINFRKREKILE